jgi:hypothetical protein
MPRPTTREEVLVRLRKTVAEGSIIVGAGAGETYFHTLDLMFYSALISFSS